LSFHVAMSCHWRALLLAGLISLGELNTGDAAYSMLSKIRLKDQANVLIMHSADPTNETEAPRESPTTASMVRSPFWVFEVLNKTEIEKTNTSNCLCKLGFFWHWRIHQCVEQGGWGYECGFFPAEHHHRVCRDLLTCQKLPGAEDNYVSSGIHEGTAKTFPASCVFCNASAGPCPKGEARHNEECLQELGLTGEACQTVRVTVPSSATASATKSHTATATATATEDGSEAEATEEKTATATHEASASANGIVENSVCVSVEDAKKELDVEDVKEVGEVLGSRIIDAGNRMAFERAYAGAMDKAKKHGLMEATAAARAIAEAKAAEEAKLEAERMAHEAAAWTAEAGANKEAKDAAAARAKSLEPEIKKAAEEETEHREAQADAEAEAQATQADAEAAQQAVADVASGQARKNQKDTIPRGGNPTDEPNSLRKITDKEVAARLP